MRELVPLVEEALGPARLRDLMREEDEYQQFWVGVLEAMARADRGRDLVGFLISNGYGAVRNMRRAEWSRTRVRHCPSCGAVAGNRTVECPRCGVQTEGSVRVSPTAMADGAELDLPDSRYSPETDLRVDAERFVATLDGARAYVARRWLLDRADLLYVNHLKQIAFELGVSPARAAQMKADVRAKFRRWYWGT